VCALGACLERASILTAAGRIVHPAFAAPEIASPPAMNVPRSCSWLVPASALALAGLVMPRAPFARDAGDAPDAAAAPTPSEAASAPASLDALALELADLARADPPGPLPALPLDPGAIAPGPIPETPPALGDAVLDVTLGRYVAPLEGGGRAILTLDPRLQARLERSLLSWGVPWGAVVVMEPATGRVLALAAHSRVEPARRDLATSALAPAASIFKVVTAAALLEEGVPAEETVCYHGGKRRLAPRVLADDPRRDRRCVTLTSAFGHSTNAVFAKLAGRGLDAARLRETAGRFLFNAPIPFARPVEVSSAEIPEDEFGLANTAAGFGKVRLSPLHGALLAATVANGGLLVPPVLVDAVEDAAWPAPAAATRVVGEDVAAELSRMMRSTVTEGTARRVFRRVAPSMRGVAVAGKTGSLADPSPYRDHSWFIGYAPADRPEIAVAAVVVNERLWRVRAPSLAKEALEAWFAQAPGSRLQASGEACGRFAEACSLKPVASR
jgi:membrane peptidoglycan carboxypeptidase